MTAEEIAAVVALLVLFVEFVVKIIALGIIPQNRRPTSAAAWLLLIFIHPWIGLLVFGLIGNQHVDRRRLRTREAVQRVIDEGMRSAPALTTGADNALVVAASGLNRRLGGLPGMDGNSVHLIEDYDASIAAMAEDIRSAQANVHIEFYIMAWDDVTEPLFAALADAVQRGVAVRLLFDHIGSSRIPGHKTMLRKLNEAGIEWYRMLPIRPLRGEWRRPDLRNHRKILVVDGVLGYTGSQNLIHPSYHNPKHERAGRRWHELVARVEGPVVESLNIVFATDWFVETGTDLRPEIVRPPVQTGADTTACQVLPSGPGFVHENNLRLFNTLVYGAKRRLSITSPYFVPDESLLYAITTAAQRGVDVELFVGEQGDQFMVHHAQRSYYYALLASGVRIYLYPAPAILHAKHMSVDDDIAVIGSSNMDIRSFALDYEVSLLCFGEGFVTAIRTVEDHYRAISKELGLQTWEQRPRRQRYLDNVMRLTSALQ